MAQHDYNLANATGANFRIDLNNALSAINSSNSGSTRPTSAVAGTVWFDTDSNQLKVYNGTNDSLIDYTDYATTATAGGTTTLTNTSSSIQFFTGTLAQNLKLPVTSTLELGTRYVIANRSTGAISVKSSGNNLITTVNAGETSEFVCILLTGTTASSWDYTTYMDLTSAQTVSGVKTFSSGVLTPSIAYKATPVTVTAWSYSGTTITLTASGHTALAGEYIEVKGLTSSGAFVPNGIWLVSSVTSNTIVYTASNTPTGTASVSSATVKGYTTINGVGAVPAISVRRDSSNQTVTSGVATKVQFNFKNYDNTGAFDNATNYRFQPTKAGYYHIASQLACGTVVTQLALMIYLNGAEQKRGTQTGGIGATFVAGDLYLNGSTDYVEIYAQLTGAAPAIAAGANYTYFDAHYITGA